MINKPEYCSLEKNCPALMEIFDTEDMSHCACVTIATNESAYPGKSQHSFCFQVTKSIFHLNWVCK